MNIILENTIYYFGGIIGAFAAAFLLRCVTSVINNKNYTRKNLILIFVMFIPSALAAQFIQNNLENLTWIKCILLSLTMFSICALYLRMKLLKSTLVIFISLIFLIITDASTAIVAYILKFDINNLLSNKYIYFLIMFIVSLSQIFLGRLLQFFFFDKKQLEAKILEANSKYIIPPFLALVLCLLLSLATLAFNNYRYSMFFILINVIQLAVVSYIGMYNLTKSIKHKETEQQFENTKMHNKSLVVINEQVKCIKHDMGNIVQAINGYLVLKEYDGAIKYCNNILNDFSSVNLLSILSPDIIDEPAIYGIIAKKKYIAEEKGVDLQLSVIASCKDINFPLVELSRSIGILLDNALEATLDTEEKLFWIDIRYDSKKKQHIIIVGNSIKDPDKIDTIKMFEHGYSTKKNPSGIGLYEIVKFMNKHNNGHITPRINKDNKTFTQELTFTLNSDYTSSIGA